jgi:hypothetical protein
VATVSSPQTISRSHWILERAPRLVSSARKRRLRIRLHYSIQRRLSPMMMMMVEPEVHFPNLRRSSSSASIGSTPRPPSDRLALPLTFHEGAAPHARHRPCSERYRYALDRHRVTCSASVRRVIVLSYSLRSVLLCSVLLCSVLFYSALLCFALLCSVFSRSFEKQKGPASTSNAISPCISGV